ncbi:gluconokinase [soil metagenome]
MRNVSVNNLPINNPIDAKLAVVVMGVSGSGKSVIGRALADRLDAAFVEGDEWHPNDNRSRLCAGTALTDAQRRPWLEQIAEAVNRAGVGNRLVVAACSALKKSYREHLRNLIDQKSLFLYLRGSFDLIKGRLETRTGHFMPAELLLSQFADLEEPEHAIVIDVEDGIESIVDRAVRELQERANTGQVTAAPSWIR